MVPINPSGRSCIRQLVLAAWRQIRCKASAGSLLFRHHVMAATSPATYHEVASARWPATTYFFKSIHSASHHHQLLLLLRRRNAPRPKRELYIKILHHLQSSTSMHHSPSPRHQHSRPHSQPCLSLECFMFHPPSHRHMLYHSLPIYQHSLNAIAASEKNSLFDTNQNLECLDLSLLVQLNIKTNSPSTQHHTHQPPQYLGQGYGPRPLI